MGTPSPARSRSRSRSRRRQVSEQSTDPRIGKNKRRSRKGNCKTRKRHKGRKYDSSSSSTSYSSGSDSSSARFKRQKRERKRSERISNHSETSVLEKLVVALNDRNNTGSPGASGLHASQNVITEFDPQAKTQTMKNWLAKVNESAHVYGWSERQTIFYALPKLSGLAKRWYEGLTSVKYSWAEWQIKLIAAFPCEHNYGELLSEMLARRSRRNESLEEYYYDKIMLINRCELAGQQAVDCLTHGIYDNNIRMNVQGANFHNPEDVLKYFRNISSKLNDFSKRFTPNVRVSEDANSNATKATNSQSRRQPRSEVTCYNCKEQGHIASRCSKPIIKCRKCRQYGHDEKNCTDTTSGTATDKRQTTDASSNQSKNVLSISQNRSVSDKYYKQIILSDRSIKAFIDLGSHCTLLRKDIGEQLGIPIDYDNLPTLNGFGQGSVIPSGRITVRIKFDGLDENVVVYLVEPDLLVADALIGHSLTELPGVRVYKSDTSLFLYKEPPSNSNKVTLSCLENSAIYGISTIKVRAGSEVTGLIYINTECCMKIGREYLLLPGVYTINKGVGSIIIIGLSSEPFTLTSNTLIARVLYLTGNLPPVTKQITNIDPSKINVLNIEFVDNCITVDQIIVEDELDKETLMKLCELLNLRRDCFSFSLEELGKTSLAEMRIQLKDHIPVTYRPYRLSLSEREKVKTIVNELLDTGIIRESTSEYASPIILVAKKNGDTRLCVDYRALNRKTLKERFPMPLIDDQIDSLSGQVFFSTLDLKSGYHQVPVSEDSKHFTAFVTPDGHYEYNRMPFGLTNAPAVFQRLVLNLLNRRKIPGVLAYMDDIIIASTTTDEGLERLTAVLDLIKDANLTLNLRKCHFFKKTIDYLGFEISSEGVRPGLKKIMAVSAFKTPQNVHEVRQFIGLASFFRRFVAGFATIARPLTCLTKANTAWTWGTEQENAFTMLKTRLTQRPILAIYNPKYQTELHTDASSTGLGGILLQRVDEGKPQQAVAYFSRQTTAEEQHFHSYELETLAVVASLNRFRVYLLGIEFKVVTDCNALRTTLIKRDLIPRIARWWLSVQEYSFTIEYRPGARLAHADALSRNSIGVSDGEQLSVMLLSDVHWLQSVQMSDPQLCYVKAILNTNSVEAKDVRSAYELKEGKIFRKVGSELRWAVPKDARWKICQLCHDDAGHFAYEKTMEKVKRDYWFPRMTQFVKKYVRACIPCAYSKQSGGKKPGFLHPIPKPDVPFHSLHIDHLGPFVKSKRGNTYILGVIDSFTKFIILRAVKNTKSKTSINVLKDVFSLFGTPKILISDRGTSFTSKEFQTFVKENGIKHTLNAVATPRANGQIERYNRSILSSLVALCHDGDDRHWDTHVPKVQWSLNNTINRSTGKSPTEIFFGRPSVNVTEGHLHELNANDPIPNDTLQKIRDNASAKIREQQDNMKHRYDRTRCNARSYKVGDLVMVQRVTKTPGESNKLAPAFCGPYRITKNFDHDRYEVSSVEGYSKKKYTNVFSVDKIKPWIRFEESESDTEYDDNEN